jgi:hypothetical protein
MNLPAPRDTLAGCVWLPRIIAKARAFGRGELPQDYQVPFCHPKGVDGQFLAHFALTREDVLAAAAKTDSELREWFCARPDAAALVRFLCRAIEPLLQSTVVPAECLRPIELPIA